MNLRLCRLVFCIIGLGLSACTSTVIYSNKPLQQTDNSLSKQPDSEGWIEMNASFYGEEHHGKATASGEVFDMYALTGAHKTLPFGTVLLVKNEEKNITIQIVVNDRGPFIPGRDLDLSWAAAKKLEMINDGVKKVKVKILS